MTEWSPTAVHSCRVTAAPNSEPCEGVPCKGPYPHTLVGDLYIVLIVPGVWALPQCALHAIHAILELYRRLCACSLTEWQCSVKPLYSGAVALQGLWPRHKEASYYMISTWHTWWPSQSSLQDICKKVLQTVLMIINLLQTTHLFHHIHCFRPLSCSIAVECACRARTSCFKPTLSLSLSTRREFMS